MADVLPEQTHLPGYGPAGFVPAGLVAPAGFSVEPGSPREDVPVSQTAPSPQGQMQQMQQMSPMQQPMQGQQMQQPMQGQMQGQQMPNNQQMPGQMQGQMQGQMNGQMQGQMNGQMNGQNMMMMQPMQNGMQMQNGQMMQQFVPMQMPNGWNDQGWNQQMQYGQQPAGWVFVPMATMGDGQQMMYDGQMNQQMMYPQQMGPMHGQQVPHVFLRPNEDNGRRGGKPWGRRRGKEDGRGRPFPGDSHKVFVGGLGPATSAKTLRAYFSQFGMLVDAAVIADGATRRSRGFGFVEFAGGIPEGVLDHEHLIENRRCGVRPYTYGQRYGYGNGNGYGNMAMSHMSNQSNDSRNSQAMESESTQATQGQGEEIATEGTDALDALDTSVSEE